MNPRKKKPVLFEVVARTQRTKARASVPRQGAWPGSTGGGLLNATGARTTAGPTVGLAGRRWPFVLAGAVVVIGVVTGVQIGWRSAQPPAKHSGDLRELFATPTPATMPRTETAYPTPSQGRAQTLVVTPGRVESEGGAGVKPAARASDEPGERPPAGPAARAAEDDDPSDRFTFTPGAYYVVVQHFRIRDRDRAVAAKAFLRGKGVECVVRRGGGDLELVATTAFSNEAAARELVKRVLDLGKEYWNSGGGYEFTGAKARRF